MVTMVVQLLLAGSLILMIAMPIVLAVLVCMRLRTRGCGLIAGQPIQPLNDAIMWGRAGPGNDRNL
jgi:hypothetical protein